MDHRCCVAHSTASASGEGSGGNVPLPSCRHSGLTGIGSSSIYHRRRSPPGAPDCRRSLLPSRACAGAPSARALAAGLSWTLASASPSRGDWHALGRVCPPCASSGLARPAAERRTSRQHVKGRSTLGTSSSSWQAPYLPCRSNNLSGKLRHRRKSHLARGAPCQRACPRRDNH